MVIVKNDETRRIKTRKISFQLKFVLFICGLVIVSNLVLAIGIYRGARNIIENEVKDIILQIAKGTAVTVDGDAIERIENGDISSKDFNEQLSIIDKMALNSDAEYIYVMKKDATGTQRFVLDSDHEEDMDSIGTAYEIMEGMALAYEGECATDDEANSDEWGTFLSGYAPIRNSADKVVAIVGVDFEYSDVLRDINKLRMEIIVILIIVTIVMLVGCYLFIRLLRVNFNILNDKIRELASGDGDLNRKVEIESGDEFEVIADSINAFIGEVRSLVKTVSVKAGDTASGLSKINSKVTELNANMEECSATTQAVSLNLDRATSKVEDIAEKVKDTDRKVIEAYERASVASKEARSHKENAVSEINEIQALIRDASEKAQAVNQVKEITKRIETIASESKILALNAEIEAARAGEAGKGFAIVAEEMGSLNAQIAESVSQISEINDIVYKTVNDLIKGTDKIDSYLTGHVLPDYDSYAELGTSYGDMTQAIRDDMSELSSQTGDVVAEVNIANESIKDINSSVGDSAMEISEVNVVSAKIASDMNNLTGMAMLKMVR